MRHSSLGILLALIAINDLHLEHMDVKTTFLHGELDEMIVIAQPESYVNPEKADHFCHLKKSLYGLKQSPRQWYLRFDGFIVESSFQRCSFDCCVYHKNLEEYSKIYLLFYVNDILIVCKNMDQINELKQRLKNAFDIKDLGAAKKILRVDLIRDRKKYILRLKQHNYIKKKYLKCLK